MSDQTQLSESRGFLSGLRGLFRSEGEGTSAGTTATQFESARDEFNTTLNSLREKVAAQRRLLQSEKTAWRMESTEERPVSDDRRIQIQREFDTAREQMRSEIQDLHQSLKTKIDPAALPALREFLLSLAEQLESERNGEIEERLRYAALVAVFNRSREISWNILNTLMNKAGEQWPEPHGLWPGASAEQIALARERALSEVQEQFMSLAPQAVGELVIGVVPAWKISYPPQDSWLWKRVSLRGVAAGIQAQIVKEVVTSLKSEGKAIREEVSGLLSNELRTLNAAIGKAAESIEQADQMARTAGTELEGLVIELILSRAQPIFERMYR